MPWTQSSPCSVYLDTTALVDMADSNERRHNEADEILRLFQHYRRSGILKVITSIWATTEAHGVLYEAELRRNGTQPPVRGSNPQNVRNVVPPSQSELLAADQTLNNLLLTLQGSTDFALWPPQGTDATPVLFLSRQLGQEAAIWPADSLHLSVALYSGCSMLITDDQDFLDKIDCCMQTCINPIRQRVFSHVNLPQFESYGLWSTLSIVPGQTSARRIPAVRALRKRGFRLR